MALTISTGFVVDDAIVMIENIARYYRRRRSSAGSALEGFRTDRFHDCFADGFADRSADSTAVHGRHCRAPFSGICDHVECHDSGVRRGIAYAHADDVREAAATQARVGSGWFYRPLSDSLTAMNQHYGQRCVGYFSHQTATLFVAVATLGATVWLYAIVPKGFFPVQDTGVILGVSEAPRLFRSQPWQSANRPWLR